MSKASRQQKKTTKQRNSYMLIGMIVVGLVAIVAAVVLLANPAQAGLPATITVSQAVEKQAEGALILDVRTPEEWVDYHIDGATLIPLDDLPNRMSEVPTDREVVLVCHSGNRSGQARDILRNAGYTNVTSMAGGLIEWQAEGYTTVSGQ